MSHSLGDPFPTESKYDLPKLTPLPVVTLPTTGNPIPGSVDQFIAPFPQHGLGAFAAFEWIEVALDAVAQAATQDGVPRILVE